MSHVKNTKRIASIDLLRIIAMFMIVAYHFSVHGGFNFAGDSITLNRLWVQFLEMGGKTGVNIFILITGYFGITAVKRNNLRVLKIWLAAFFYSVVIYCAFVLSGNAEFGMLQFIKHIFPITFSEWWFITAYFMLCLISPYLNNLLNGLSKKEYLCLLIIMTLCWCVTSTFLTVSIECNNFLWFTYIYALAGYMRLYGVDKKGTAGVFYLSAAILILLAFSLVVAFDIIGLRVPVFAQHATYFFGMQKIPALLIAIFIFLAFLKTDIKDGKLIRFISPAMLGVYLLHDNAYIRVLLWNRLFKSAIHANDKMLILFSIGEIVLVFVICTALELLRIHLLEKNYTNVLSRFVAFLSKKKNRLLDQIA